MPEAQQGTRPRIAILGLHLESNAFAPPSGEAQFRSLCYVQGEAITREARKDPSALPAEVPAFYAEMDRLSPWTAAPILVTAAEPGGTAESVANCQEQREREAGDAAQPGQDTRRCSRTRAKTAVVQSRAYGNPAGLSQWCQGHRGQ